MMLRKPTCADCPHNLQYMERLPIKKKGVTMHLGERFCVAGKRARKFKRSDPKTYVPSWCPRLKAPCELRIYGFKNQREWRMHRSMRAYLGEDTAVCSFSIAVDRDFKSKNGEKETDFIDIVAWRATAEFVSKYFTKGRMAVVEGRLQIRDWTDKEGGKRRSAEVIADNVYFGDSKPKDGGEEDDIPAYTGAPDSFAVPDGFTPDFGGESGEMPF